LSAIEGNECECSDYEWAVSVGLVVDQFGRLQKR
jgi:hypothetical protein